MTSKDDKYKKQVNIALDDNDYVLLKTIALLERRSISEIARLILIDNAKKLYSDKYVNFKPAHFIPGVLPGDDPEVY